MFKKNTRKRLLAGALATVMMLTMCPSWALADDDGITPLPLVDENRPVAESAPVEADTTETPAVPTPSETEDQNTAPAPSDDGANGGTDSAETGNSTNPTIPEGSENNSQKNNVASSSPDVNNQPQDAADINDVSTASLVAVPYGWNDVQTIDAQCWITNRHAKDAKGNWKLNINKNTVRDGNGTAVTDLANAKIETESETYVFWQARVLGKNNQQTEEANVDRTKNGTEIDRICYVSDWYGLSYHLEYHDKQKNSWKSFDNDDQLVFYYLIRTEYSQMVQIDVSDWTVNDEPTDMPNRRSVTYQVYVKGGNEDGSDKPAGSRTFWYNSPLTVSSVLVREADANHYTIDSVELEPNNLGAPAKNENGEYQFSLHLSNADTDNATVKIYVTPKNNVQKHTLTYDPNGGTIDRSSKYTPEGSYYPEEPVIVPKVEKKDHTFEGWYDAETGTKYGAGAVMPNKNLKLTAHWTANPPVTPPVDPEVKKYEAKYFVLLPNCGEPKSSASQGWTNYLPNKTSDGGVMGATRETGYKGHLTEAGKKAADKGEFNANGVNPDYLVVPSDLGFFTRANWSGTTYPNYPADKTDTSVDKITELLGTNYNPLIAEVVWYTVKYDSTDGYHVDGYVKNVDVTVTYHSNFGDTEQTKICTATTGKEYKALDYTKTGLPDRTNYTFDGWYTNRDCTEKTAYKTDTLMTSLDLYAKWVPDNFKVSYYVDGVQDGEIEDHAVDSVVSQRGKLTKEGHTFSGWTPATDVASIIKVENGKFTMPAKNVCFNGTFVANKYTVNWVYEDGTAVCDPEQVEYNTTPKSDPQPTKADDDKFSYTFKGWKVKDGDDTFVNPKSTPVTANVTYVAVFESVTREYHVTYLVGGTEYAKDTYKVGADVAIRPVPTKDGYTFSGWKIGTADAENFKMPAHDVTIEGTFAKNSSGGHHHRRPTVTIPDEVPTGLNGNDHYAYIVGYPDKTVRPQNGITRAEVATIFFRLLTDETRDANSTKSNSYSDVAAGAWYNHAVSTLSAMGIVKGSNGKFNPNAPITRAEFAAIAARFDDKANTTTADFSDIASHWAKNEISAASNNGWINGYPDGTFRPDNKITRAEAMTLVNRVLKRLPETAEDLHDDMIKWSDNSDVSQWFYLDVQEATNSHYYQTKENQFEKWTELRETRDWTELEK